jgi:hypothetical protein
MKYVTDFCNFYSFMAVYSPWHLCIVLSIPLFEISVCGFHLNIVPCHITFWALIVANIRSDVFFSFLFLF